jgi:fluoride exporter
MAILTIGGALGVNARYWLGVWMSRWVSPQFPWATFTINVSGSFAIGFLTILLARWQPQSPIRLLVVVGFLGGYTTFSTFSFESLTLWERGELSRALGYVVGSVIAGLAAVTVGAALAHGLILTVSERFSQHQTDVRVSRTALPRFSESAVDPPADGDTPRGAPRIDHHGIAEQAIDEQDTETS